MMDSRLDENQMSYFRTLVHDGRDRSRVSFPLLLTKWYFSFSSKNFFYMTPSYYKQISGDLMP